MSSYQERYNALVKDNAALKEQGSFHKIAPSKKDANKLVKHGILRGDGIVKKAAADAKGRSARHGRKGQVIPAVGPSGPLFYLANLRLAGSYGNLGLYLVAHGFSPAEADAILKNEAFSANYRPELLQQELNVASQRKAANPAEKEEVLLIDYDFVLGKRPPSEKKARRSRRSSSAKPRASRRSSSPREKHSHNFKDRVAEAAEKKQYINVQKLLDNGAGSKFAKQVPRGYRQVPGTVLVAKSADKVAVADRLLGANGAYVAAFANAGAGAPAAGAPAAAPAPAFVAPPLQAPAPSFLAAPAPAFVPALVAPAPVPSFVPPPALAPYAPSFQAPSALAPAVPPSLANPVLPAPLGVRSPRSPRGSVVPSRASPPRVAGAVAPPPAATFPSFL